MTAEVVDGLRALAAALPPDTPVPVPAGVLRELLAGDAFARDASSGPSQPSPQGLAPADHTVAELATRFGKRPSTVRAWVERGEFPGAYRLHGREWRIPAASLATFEAHARNRRRPEPPGKGRAVNLAAWRTAS